MTASHERRLAALEARTSLASEGQRPWVTLFWHYGETEPAVPEGCHGIIVRIVSPADPPEWINPKREAA